MVELGVGKNMVRSMRFWSQAAGVVLPAQKKKGYFVTPLGRSVLSPRGADPFLEDAQTLWLIHWKLSTNVETPLLAWDFLLNRNEPEIVPTTAVRELEKHAIKHEDKLSTATLRQHFEAFLHSYVPTRGRKGEIQEDNLDCPLVELELLIKIGERETDGSGGRREPIYAFRREEKPEISQELFSYCVADFWKNRRAKELTVLLRDVAHGHGSPGQIFKIPEQDVRERVEGLARGGKAWFTYKESANLEQLHRRQFPDESELLSEVFSSHDG